MIQLCVTVSIMVVAPETGYKYYPDQTMTHSS